MVFKMIMPKISLTMTEGTIVKWYKHEGDVVKKDELLVDISSDKTVFGETAPNDGILLKIVAENDAVLPVGGVIAYIGSEDEKAALQVETITTKKIAPVTVETVESVEPAPRRPSPLTAAARRWVKENGLDLAEIEASFAGRSRVTTVQLEEWLDASKAVAPVTSAVSEAAVPLGFTAAAVIKTAASRRKLVGMRKIIASSMVNSKHTAPHATICREVDMSGVVKLRNQRIGFGAVKHSVTDYVTMAVTRALPQHLIVNSSLIEDEIITWQEINVGVAVSTPNGLTVPVIHNADRLSFDQISLETKELVARALNNKMTESDYSGGTFTVSSMGMMGIDMFTPVINQPEAAILGVGRIVQKPVIKEGQITIASMMFLSLSFDHRILDGSDAADFLDSVASMLETPSLFNTNSYSSSDS